MSLTLSPETEARILALAAEQGTSAEAVVDHALSSLPAAPSPLMDRLGTADGRARAIAVLHALRTAPADPDDDDYDIEKALAQNPFTLREVHLPED